MVKAENACVIRHLPEPAKPFSFEKWIAPSRNGKVETKRWEKIKKKMRGGIAKDEKSDSRCHVKNNNARVWRWCNREHFSILELIAFSTFVVLVIGGISPADKSISHRAKTKTTETFRLEANIWKENHDLNLLRGSSCFRTKKCYASGLINVTVEDWTSIQQENCQRCMKT